MLNTWFHIVFVLHRFATLATRMEQYIQGQSRDLVDQAYTKFVSPQAASPFYFNFNLFSGLMLVFGTKLC